MADKPVVEAPETVEEALRGSDTAPAEVVEVKQVGRAPVKENVETVTITRETFDELMKTVGDIQKTQDAMLQTTDKNQLNEIERLRAGGRLVKSVKLRSMDGMIVLGWKTVKNDVYMQDGKLVEDQTLEVFFEDESKKELRLRDWVSMHTYLPFEVIEESKDANGVTYFTVRKDDGKEVKVAANFVN